MSSLRQTDEKYQDASVSELCISASEVYVGALNICDDECEAKCKGNY